MIQGYPMIKKLILKLSVLLLTSGFLYGCGNDSEAPVDGSITIAIGANEWTVFDDPADPSPACIGAFIDIEAITISVFDVNGTPLGNVDIDVMVQLAGNTSADGVGLFGFGVVDLWDDLDGNDGITDNTTGAYQMNEHISGLTNPQIFKTKTGPNGTRTLFITADVSPDCEYTTSISVRSGTVIGLLEFDVAV